MTNDAQSQKLGTGSPAPPAVTYLLHPSPQVAKQPKPRVRPCKGTQRGRSQGWTERTRSTNAKSLFVLRDLRLILGGLTLERVFPEDAALLKVYRDGISRIMRRFHRPFWAVFEGDKPHIHMAILSRHTERTLRLVHRGQPAPDNLDDLDPEEIGLIQAALADLLWQVFRIQAGRDFAQWQPGNPDELASYMMKRFKQGKGYEPKGRFPWLTFTPYFSAKVPRGPLAELRKLAPKASGSAKARAQYHRGRK